MKRTLKVWTLCLGTAFLLCACGNGSTKTTEDAAETGSETVGETEAEVEDTTLYAYDYDVESLVTLGEYKGLTYTLMDTTVSDDEVQEDIDNTLLAHASKEQITDRAAEDGDTVNIDFEGLLDGVAFDGGTAQGASLTLGSNSFIEGFEEGLVGVKPGEQVSLNLTFPDPYEKNVDLAGKDVVFNVTINYIEGDDITPELDDAFVQELAIENVTTVDAYRDYVREQLKAQKESEAESSRQSELFQKAVENAEVKEYPEELVSQYREEFNSYYNQYAAYFGLELTDFLTQYMDLTEEEFNEEADKYGQEATANMLVLCAIAKAEGVEVTDELYAEKTSEYAQQNGYTDAATLEADYGKGYLKQVIINEKVMEILEKDAKGVEAAETEAETVTETE